MINERYLKARFDEEHQAGKLTKLDIPEVEGCLSFSKTKYHSEDAEPFEVTITLDAPEVLQERIDRTQRELTDLRYQVQLYNL